MTFVEKEIPNDIMATDTYIYISSEKYSKHTIEDDINVVIETLRSFENNYSRFITGNELYKLNESSKIKVSNELLDILELSKKYFKITSGVFDPTVYNSLQQEGYIRSKNEGYVPSSPADIKNNDINFDLVKISKESKIISKPENLKIDLGGIGKGYIIDKISEYLKPKYSDFCISLGGDIYLNGKDSLKGYPYWAIEIENPFTRENSIDLPTLLLTNKAIATSGINKRHWTTNGNQKNHIINPSTKSSLENNLICVTVIGDTTVFSDILAKTLLILGVEKGMKYCQNNTVPAVFVTKTSEVYLSEDVKKYVWKQ